MRHFSFLPLTVTMRLRADNDNFGCVFGDTRSSLIAKTHVMFVHKRLDPRPRVLPLHSRGRGGRGHEAEVGGSCVGATSSCTPTTPYNFSGDKKGLSTVKRKEWSESLYEGTYRGVALCPLTAPVEPRGDLGVTG